jgi:hypothetical protein
VLATRLDPATFLVEFDSEDELRAEHATNLAHSALRLPTAEKIPLYTPLTIIVRAGSGSDVILRGTVVALFPDALALALDGDPPDLATLLPRKATEPESEPDERTKQTTWDRLRSLSQMEKILLAVKADKSERALLGQDTDPRVLLSLLRNPRITVEEVGRLARSSTLNYQIADVIMRSSQWSASLDVRLGLIHNAKTPQQFALKILPTLPENEIRTIARTGTSMALKQAALRRLQKS